MSLLGTFALNLLQYIASIRKDLGMPALRVLCFLSSEYSPVCAENGRRLTLDEACYALVKQTDRSGHSYESVRRTSEDELEYVDAYSQEYFNDEMF